LKNREYSLNFLLNDQFFSEDFEIN